MAWRSLQDQASVASERDVTATLDPAFVDRDGCAVVADARGQISLTGSGSHDETDDAEAVGGDCAFAERVVAVIVVERSGGEVEEGERDEELVLRLGFDLAFGVEGELLVGCRVGSCERRLDVLGGAGRENNLAEVEVKGSGATEHASWFGLCDGSYHRGAFGHGDGVVGVVFWTPAAVLRGGRAAWSDLDELGGATGLHQATSAAEVRERHCTRRDLDHEQDTDPG